MPSIERADKDQMLMKQRRILTTFAIGLCAAALPHVSTAQAVDDWRLTAIIYGYLPDIGVPFDPNPMDFHAWFEAYVGGAWRTFDARHNRPRIGRVLIARGRDAVDTAILTSYGPSTLTAMSVWAAQVDDTTTLNDPPPQPQQLEVQA